MKHFCTVLFTLVILISTVVLSASAEAETASISWNGLRLRALYVQNDKKLTSDINPDFSADWPSFEIPEAGTSATCTVNMRGFAMSPDGRYMYMGIQHGGGDVVRGMYVMETMTGKITDFVYRYDGDVCDGTRPHFSYPKGISTDERGYVYVGYTLSTSYNAAYLAIYRQESDGTLTHVSELPVCSLGTPGYAFGTKVGINGVAVRELDGQTYAYVVTNYDHDSLLRVDVTNPEKPMFDTEFGKDGVQMLPSDVWSSHGYTLDEAQYLDVARNGTIYLAFNATDGRDGIAVLSRDGQICHRIHHLNGVYSMLVYGDYLLCGARTGGQVTVIDRETGKTVGAISTIDNYGERLTRLQITQDVLFVCDAGSVQGVANAIYAAPLNARGKAYLNAITDAQNSGTTDWYETETDMVEMPTEAATAPETVYEPIGTDSATEDHPPATGLPKPPASAVVTIGCQSAMAASALLLLPAAWLIMRKKP